MSGDAADELPRLRTAVRLECEACRAGFAGIDRAGLFGSVRPTIARSVRCGPTSGGMMSDRDCRWT